MSQRLVLFSRVPVLGRVKTRLAARVGADQALAIHRYLLRDSLARGCELNGIARELCLDVADVNGECKALADRYGFELSLQSAGDLGVRMASAFERALQVSQSVVLIGSDCPLLDAGQLSAAFMHLQSHDAVFAPVSDGGYALVGLRRPMPLLFQDIAWSTASVMSATRQRLRAANARWAELPVLWDIDEAADWDRWCDLTPDARAQVEGLRRAGA